jgi:hypothetical protein
MGIDQIVLKLLEYGVLGIAVVLLTGALTRKDKQVTALYIRLIEQSDRNGQKYHELAEAMTETMEELAASITDEKRKSVDKGSTKEVQKCSDG